MIRETLLTLKQHLFELTLAAGISGAIGTVAVLSTTLPGASADGTGPLLIEAMKVVPFLIGVLGGVPLVSRELEERTVLIAWSLSASRRRWLLRQIVPVLAVVVLSASFAAAATAAAAAALSPSPEQAFEDIGAYGPAAVARALGAFGLGLVLGALLGRAMPALVFTAIILALSVLISVEGRHRWLMLHEPVVASASNDVLVTGQVLMAPDGSPIPLADALERVPTDAEPMAWLDDQGYVLADTGVPLSAAMQWATYEVAGFGAVALAGIAGTLLLVDRRRPT